MGEQLAYHIVHTMGGDLTPPQVLSPATDNVVIPNVPKFAPCFWHLPVIPTVSMPRTIDPLGRLTHDPIDIILPKSLVTAPPIFYHSSTTCVITEILFTGLHHI